jgi:hypothetical protein
MLLLPGEPAKVLPVPRGDFTERERFTWTRNCEPAQKPMLEAGSMGGFPRDSGRGEICHPGSPAVIFWIGACLKVYYY